jgi:nicotinamide-nucleotide amidase
LTDISGSSRYVHAGWVLYSNEAKIRLLGVEPEILETKGAVSREVAEAMALGARRRAEVDFGIGVTGIAGPAGGTKEKPVGTVWVALAGPGVELLVRGFQLPGERERVKYQASQVALDMLRRALFKLS